MTKRLIAYGKISKRGTLDITYDSSFFHNLREIGPSPRIYLDPGELEDDDRRKVILEGDPEDLH